MTTTTRRLFCSLVLAAAACVQVARGASPIDVSYVDLDGTSRVARYSEGDNVLTKSIDVCLEDPALDSYSACQMFMDKVSHNLYGTFTRPRGRRPR